jgi:hypothetical protein
VDIQTLERISEKRHGRGGLSYPTLGIRTSQETRMSTTKQAGAQRTPAPKTTPQANKAALRDAIAAINADSAERYIALFRPDVRLHGFPQAVGDVDALIAFHAATAHIYPRRHRDP